MPEDTPAPDDFSCAWKRSRKAPLSDAVRRRGSIQARSDLLFEVPDLVEVIEVEDGAAVLSQEKGIFPHVAAAGDLCDGVGNVDAYGLNQGNCRGALATP